MPARDRVSYQGIRDSVTQPTRRICIRRPPNAQHIVRRPLICRSVPNRCSICGWPESVAVSQALATFAALKKSAGMGRCSFHDDAIGRSPLCDT